MSFWNSGHKNVVEESLEFIKDFPKNQSTRIDATLKLQVIQALDNGQCKSDIAREYGIPPQVISSIYKQKDTIVKKYTHKYNLLKEICSLNLERTLLDWLEQQFKSGKVITEDHLHKKTQEILKGLSEEFSCIDDWLFSFRIRHNISKYTSDDVSIEKAKEEWKKFLNSSDSNKEVYLGGVCALSHNLDFYSYLNGKSVDNYVSLLFIVNILGTDKREVAVVGKELMDTEIHVRSLPVNYYFCANPQVNYSIVLSFLTKWENELQSKGTHITLVLDVPEGWVANLNLQNIRIVTTTDLKYISNILEKIVECFKYHYRRLQISRTLTYGKDNSSLLDYIHMIGMAWYNIPHKYVQSLCFPPGDGSLFFNVKDVDSDHSISRWCKMYNVPLNVEQCPSSLDKYMSCDKNLPCIYHGQLDESMQATEVLNEKVCQSTSGTEAYQAMKRIVSYLQGESAGNPVMKYAKYLENHLEYGALLQMHQIIASTNDSIN